MTSPLTAVLSALAEGASSRPAVVAATGLPRDVVDAAVEHLQRLGRIEVRRMSTECADFACGGCRFAAGCPLGNTRRR